MRGPPLTDEMKAAGMEWRPGKKHWRLYHCGELITVWPHGSHTDPLSRNGKMTRLAIKRKLRQLKGENHD
jgi:hypothetical protein